MDVTTVSNQITLLNNELTRARQAYYVDVTPVLPDAEYDAKEKQLTGLVSAYPEFAYLATVLKTVGSDISTGDRIKHIRRMVSIENKYTKADVEQWCRQFPPDTEFCIEPKQDGVSCELRYHNHELAVAVSRGTSNEGEEMTRQVLALNSIPKKLPVDKFPASVNVRGELVMRDSELERINGEALAKGTKTYGSTRNLTAGTMKQKDMTVVASREILLIPWDAYSEDDDALPDKRDVRLFELARYAGFPEHRGVVVSRVEDVVAAIDKILELNSKSDVRADGVVIKVNSVKLSRELGDSNKFANYQICFKPQSASNTTYLRRVVWQIGRSGKLTPVAECDPVVLAGATVTRANLNNLSWIVTMGLKVGSKIEMLRSGDVIPKVTKVLDDSGEEIIPPTQCPECGSVLVVADENHTGIITHSCENPLCPGRIADYFTYIGGRDVLEIDGLADEMAKKLVRDGYARNLGELFIFQTSARKALDKLGEAEFTKSMKDSGFDVTIVKMVRSMEKAKTVEWERWLAALGIPAIGKELGRRLAMALKLGPEDMSQLPGKLREATKMNIEGLGFNRNSIIEAWAASDSNRNLCLNLSKCGVHPTSMVVETVAGEPLKDIAFVISGTFPEDRDSLTKKLEALGAVAKPGLSKNVNLFIVGDEAGKSKLSKYEDLVNRGCKIEKVGLDWLQRTLSAHGMEMKGVGFEVEEA